MLLHRLTIADFEGWMNIGIVYRYLVKEFGRVLVVHRDLWLCLTWSSQRWKRYMTISTPLTPFTLRHAVCETVQDESCACINFGYNQTPADLTPILYSRFEYAMFPLWSPTKSRPVCSPPMSLIQDDMMKGPVLWSKMQREENRWW
jgi:hypothetical protein